mgnify:CR=1 FL=1
MAVSYNKLWKLLIDKKFKVYAIPLNFEEFDGSPCRVFAEVE